MLLYCSTYRYPGLFHKMQAPVLPREVEWEYEGAREAGILLNTNLIGTPWLLLLGLS